MRSFDDSPPETLPDFSKESPESEDCPVERMVTVLHRSGQISADVKAVWNSDGDVEIQTVSVSRTARRLFEGNVLVSL